MQVRYLIYQEALKLGRKEGWAKDGYGYRKEGKGKMLSVRKPELLKIALFRVEKLSRMYCTLLNPWASA